MNTESATVAVSGRIIRKDLLALLDHSAKFPLTLVLAPAGSGKSTLLKQWQSMRPSNTVIRLALQNRDNEPVQFFRHLIDALRQVIPDFDAASYNPFSTEIALPPAAVAESILQALEGVRDEVFIILDDFQHANSSLIQQVVATLLEQLPSSVHFILSSRNYPDFSLSRLKLDDRLLLIDAHDLRISRDHVQEMSNSIGGEALPESHIDRLLELTEGWISGVKIALFAYARSGIAALESFDGSQPDVVDYFAYVVLRGLTESMRDFFLQSSLFERFNAELCDQVLQRDDSAALLHRITSQELFLQPIEDKPGWFRYHALLHDFLQNRLRVEQPDVVSGIHLKAAQHFLSQGDAEQALFHASQSKDQQFFIATLEKSCEQWLRNGDFGDIVHWLQPLPEEQVLHNSSLTMALICALILSRRFNQARYYLDARKELLSVRGPITTYEASTLNFLELSLQLFQHDTNFRLDADVQLLMSTGGHRDIRAFSLAIIAYHNLLHADFKGAMTYATQAKAVLSQMGHHFLESYADLIIALCDRSTGRVISAMRHVEEAYRRVQNRPHTPSWINISTAVVVARYEQNRLEEAQQLCEELIPIVSSSCATEVIATVYLTLSRLLCHQGMSARASRLLDQLSRILQLGNYDRFVSQVAQESMRQNIALGHLDLADRTAQRYGLASRLAAGTWKEPRPYEDSWERYGLATAYWLIARRHYNEAEEVLNTLSESLNQSGTLSRALVVDANRVVLKVIQGREPEALNLLCSLIKEHGLTNFNRSVFDEAPGISDFLGQAVQNRKVTLPKVYMEVFGPVIPIKEKTAPAPTAEVISLTSKEQEILELLANGLPNTEISKRTGTALSTTKWHLKNIYAKLGVANRTEAVVLMSRNRN